jgi:hypothetical protein
VKVEEDTLKFRLSEERQEDGRFVIEVEQSKLPGLWAPFATCSYKPFAQLMAAAPDLEQAGCITVRTLEDCLRHHELPESCREALGACVSDLRAAIKKAEG